MPGRTSFYAGLGILLFFLITAISAPLLAPYHPDDYAGAPLLKPGEEHWLGTDDMGQDIFSQLIWGSRISVWLGFSVGIVSMILATGAALAAGVCGGKTDRLLMRIVDLFLVFPRLPSIILLAVFLGPGTGNLIFVLSFFSWAKGVRVIRSQILTLVKSPHAEACMLFGAGRFYIMRQHILPEVLPLSAFKFLKSAGYALSAESGLAFLGIADPSMESWGMMFHYALAYPGIYYSRIWLWWFFPPALCLMLCMLSFLLLSAAVEEFAHPRVLKDIR